MSDTHWSALHITAEELGEALGRGGTVVLDARFRPGEEGGGVGPGAGLAQQVVHERPAQVGVEPILVRGDDAPEVSPLTTTRPDTTGSSP